MVNELKSNQYCDNADFWLDDVSCLGTELLLKDCPHLNWGVHNCNW